VVFSLYGRKDGPPTKEKITAGANAGRGDSARAPAPLPTRVEFKPQAVPDPGGDDWSLDFSRYTPPARPGTAPPVARLAGVRAAPKVAAAAARSESGAAAQTAAVIEAAAIVFADGQPSQALEILANAVKGGDLGASALQVWLMLLDLQQLLGMKAEFEALGMKFLATFERSPPVWTAPEPRFDPEPATRGIDYCGLTGVLSDASASQFESLLAMGERRQVMRIDFAKLQGIDATGCARLLEALHRLGTQEVVFTGEAHLLGLLQAQCQEGSEKAGSPAWALRFEILRRLGLKERFEEDAVNFAIACNVSPPSWPCAEGRSTAKWKPGPHPGRIGTEPEQPALRLSGELTGANESLAKTLTDWAASNSPMLLDMSAVGRVDFVTTGLLLNTFTKLHRTGTVVQIRGANELIAALFGLMGIDRVARIIRRR